MYEVSDETEHCINNDNNRMIKASPNSKIYGLDSYNICKRFKVGDRVYKRVFNNKKKTRS